MRFWSCSLPPGLLSHSLGAFYYYGTRDFAAKATSQNTVEWEDGDLVWNAVTFHTRLFRAWLHGPGSGPVLWTPKHIWIGRFRPMRWHGRPSICASIASRSLLWFVSGMFRKRVSCFVFSRCTCCRSFLEACCWRGLFFRTVKDQRAERASDLDMDAEVVRDLSSASALGGCISIGSR